MIIGAAIVAVGVAVLLYAEWIKRSALRCWAKPLASAGFLLAALDAPTLHLPTGTGWLLLAALALCALGDVLLLGTKTRTFLVGMASFALAHVLRLVWFGTAGARPLALAGAVASFLVIGHVGWMWLDGSLSGRLRLPVRLYILLLSLATALAVAYGVSDPRDLGGAALLPTLGAVLFLVSDLAVARQRFVKPAFANRAFGLPLYYASQLLFAAFLSAL